MYLGWKMVYFIIYLTFFKETLVYYFLPHFLKIFYSFIW